MDSFMFVYTMLVLFVCLGAAFLQFAVAGSMRSATHAALGVFFFFYVVELGCIFLEEFLSQNMAFPESSYYEILNPVARTIFSTLLLGSAWAVALTFVERFSTARFLVPTLIFAASQVICIVALPYGPIRQYLYYTVRQIFMLGVLAYLWHMARSSSSEHVVVRLRAMTRPMLIVLACILGILIEDTVVMLLLDPVMVNSLPLYLAERNFIENIAVVSCAVLVSRWAVLELTFRLRQTPAPLPRDGADQVFASRVNQTMPRFAQTFGLTPREQDVLELLLEGKSNTEMASTLYLSSGTIKTHVHNIMKKVDAPDREGLRKLFWQTS